MHPDTPSDPPYAYLPYGVGQLAYTDEGTGPQTLLAIAGLPGTVRDFRWLAPALNEHVRFVRIDLPGFGKSTRSGYEGMSLAERSAAVLALIKHLELSRVTLVTHSSGGTVAGELARHHPELVAGCALLACPGPRPHYPAGVYRLLSGLFRSAAGRAVTIPLQRVVYRAAGFPSYLTDDERMYTSLDAAVAHFDLHSANLQSMTRPALVAWARDDRLIPVDIYEALEEVAPAGPRIRFDTGGHNIQKTRATEIAEAVLKFVGSLD